MTDKSKLGQNI